MNTKELGSRRTLLKQRAKAFVLALVTSTACAAIVNAQDLIVTNATILDPQTRTAVQGSLWMEGGVIVGRGSNPPQSARGERVDVQGKWVIPGLTDLHVHSFSNQAPGGVQDAVGTEAMATRVLRAGVTAFLDLFSLEDAIFALRDRQRRAEVGGAEIFASGACLTATKGHCTEYGIPTRTIDSPDDARRQVAELASKGADVIKVVYDHAPGARPSIDRATLDAVVAAARAHQLKTIVHVGVWEDVRHAAQAGAVVTHVPSDGPVPEDVVALMAARRTVHIPTLAVHTDRQAFLDTPALLDAPLLVALAPEAIRRAYRAATQTPEQAATRRAAVTRTIESVRSLHAAGVPLLTGTDAGNWGVVHGYSVHRELIRLVESGLTPWEALAASTTQAGEFLGRRYGVGPGDEANLVVLEASPLVDIANTQKIAMVIMRGRIAFQR